MADQRLGANAARKGGGGHSVLFGTAKGFVSSFTRGLVTEEARFTSRVNAMALGVTDKSNNGWTTPSHQVDAALRMTPMNRKGAVEECVGAHLYLVSGELSSFVTGQIIEVNCGLLMP
jgi:3-oxoacyl-[acyl-carrier protein] reductase